MQADGVLAAMPKVAEARKMLVIVVKRMVVMLLFVCVYLARCGVGVLL